MTNEEKVAKLAELDGKLRGQVKSFNDAMLDGRFNDATKLNSEMEETVGEYAGIARGICFDKLAATENPMLEAVKQLSYPVLAVKDVKRDKDDAVATREVIEKDRQIDLLKLHKYVEGGIGHDDKWNNYVEKFNFLMTAQKAVDLGIDPKSVNDSYAMSDISKQINMGKTPTSKTNILKTLTKVIQAMIGEEYKPTSHDVAFLLSVYSKKSRKALTVTCANHKYMRGYLMEICNRIVTDKTYSIEFKAVRQ